MARIHPTKGISILLDAWKAIESQFPDWELHIVGPVQNTYARQMVDKAASLRLNRVFFEGELTGIEKSRAFLNSDLYVLPSHSENFGISVAEALAHGVPAIVFQGAPWSGLECRRAGWWIEPGTDSLVEALRTAMGCPSDVLRTLGENGHRWMQEEFDWTAIAQKMAGVYEALSHGGPTPPELFAC